MLYTFHLENGERINKEAEEGANLDDLIEKVSNETGWCVESVEN